MIGPCGADPVLVDTRIPGSSKGPEGSQSWEDVLGAPAPARRPGLVRLGRRRSGSAVSLGAAEGRRDAGGCAALVIPLTTTTAEFRAPTGRYGPHGPDGWS